MVSFLMGNSIWQLIVQSDAVSKLVLLILLCLSIACWTVFLYKLVLLRIKRKHMQQALIALKSMHSVDDMLQAGTQLTHTVPGYFLSKNLSFLKLMLESNKERGKSELSHQEWELLHW